MTPADRREVRVAIAMLPVGVLVLVISALALPLVVGFGIDLAVRQPAGWSWTALWCAVAALVSVWNMRAGIAMMSAFDWRPLPATLLRSFALVAGWLALA